MNFEEFVYQFYLNEIADIWWFFMIMTPIFEFETKGDGRMDFKSYTLYQFYCSGKFTHVYRFHLNHNKMLFSFTSSTFQLLKSTTNIKSIWLVVYVFIYYALTISFFFSFFLSGFCYAIHIWNFRAVWRVRFICFSFFSYYCYY